MAGSASEGLNGRLHRMRPMLAGAGLAFALLSPLLVLLGVVGVHAGLFGPRVGLGLLTLRLAPPCAMLGAILGVIALVLAMAVSPRRGFVMPLVAVAVGALSIGAFLLLQARAAATPPVHDVATDWREPIGFSPKLMQLRAEGADPVEPDPVAPSAPGTRTIASEHVSAVNARTCPAATPVVLTQPVDAAYSKAKAALVRAGLALVTDDRAAGVLEATATSFWFALKDDVAMRVRGAGAGTRIDLRSVSRLGVNDLGANCAHITRLRRMLAG